MSLFANYEQDFLSVVRSVAPRLDSIDSADPKARRNTLRAVEVDLQQAESLLRQLEVESRSDPTKREREKVREHRSALKALQDRFESVRQRSERAELLERGGGEGLGGADPNAAHRQRYEEVTARMERSRDTLRESQRTVMETENVAAGITEQLHNNREQILNVHERVRETGGILGESIRIVTSMQRRGVRRKLCYGGALLFFFIVVILIIYAASSGGDSGNSTMSPTLQATPSPSP